MPNRIVIVRQTHIFTPDPKEIDADAVLTATVRRGDEGRFQPVRGGDDDGVVLKREQGAARHMLLGPGNCFRFSEWMRTGPGGYSLTISSGVSGTETVFFSSCDEALAFRGSLVRTGNLSFVGNFRLRVHERSLNSGGSGQLQGERKKVNWR